MKSHVSIVVGTRQRAVVRLHSTARTTWVVRLQWVRILRAAALVVAGTSAFAGRVEAQSGLGRCAEPALGSRGEGDAALVHPEVLRARFADKIVAKQWITVIDGYHNAVNLVLRGVSPASNAARAARDSLLLSTERLLIEARDVVALPQRTWAAALSRLDINQTRPVLRSGSVILLQSEARPRGIALPTEAADSVQVDALCWASWSVYQLLHGINSETVLSAAKRVEATASRWSRYTERGPLQLPHELAVNRLLRAIGVAGGGRYDPPVFEVIVGHPFAGFELRRQNGAVLQQATIAAHLGGFTLWLADRRFPLSASWVASAAGDVVGQGPFLRLGELAGVGYIDRRPPGGRSVRTVSLHLDALAFLVDDERAKKVLSLLGLSAATLEGAEQK